MFARVATSRRLQERSVTQVAEDTPAARSGLKEGDMLLQVGKKKIATPRMYLIPPPFTSVPVTSSQLP